MLESLERLECLLVSTIVSVLIQTW